MDSIRKPIKSWVNNAAMASSFPTINPATMIATTFKASIMSSSISYTQN